MLLAAAALLALATAAGWGPRAAGGLSLPSPTLFGDEPEAPGQHELAVASDEASMRLDKQIPWQRRAKHWSNVILDQRHKLAFCYIPKNACSRMTGLFNHLNLLIQRRSGFQSSTAGQLGVNMSEVTHENGWKFAYFTRDPLSRYASAFASKCIPSPTGEVEGGGADCGGPVIFDHKEPEDYVGAFERRAEQDGRAGHLFDNEHWRLQAEILTNCGWENFNPDVADFIGDLSSGVDVNRQVQKMLKMAGVRNVTAVNMANRYFPSKQVKGHTSMAHDRASLARLYRKPSVIRAVLKLYERDYEMLRLPKPLFARLADLTDGELGYGGGA